MPTISMFLSAVALALAPLRVLAQTQVAPGEFVFVAGGDMIGPYRTMKGVDDPAFKRVAAWFQKADLGFANQEGSLFDLTTFAGYPSGETGGGYPVAPPALAQDYHD